MANDKEQNILELEEFKANSFLGINSENPIVIDFTARRKNQNFVEFTGDQGTRKTSTLLGILFAMGGTFNLDKKKLFNRQDGGIDVNLKFSYDGEQYQVVANSTRTELKKLNEAGKWKPEDSPVAMLRKIFGPVGLSPLSVREMKGKDQIKFFQQMFGSGEDASKKMAALESDIDKIFTNRRDINRDTKQLSAALELEPLFQNREASEQKFAKPISADKEKKAFEEKKKKHEDFEKYSQALGQLKEEQTDNKMDLDRLRKELAAAEKNEKELAERVEKGEKWVKENNGIVKEYEAAQKEWLNLSQKLADFEKWKDILRREKTFNDKTEQSVTLTGELDEKREELLKLTRKCLPKVEGLSIKVAAGLDKEDKPEGVFFGDQPIHELSQSEYESLWAQIFVAAEVPFLFFENLNNFGSMTMGLLNRLAKEEGVVVFGTRTNPSVKEIGIAFETKLVQK